MKIVMVDQDGVVCDTDYQPTADIRNIVDECVTEGMVIVPNSDTPEKRITNNFSFMVGFTPSIVIAEKGAIVRIHDETIHAIDRNSRDLYVTRILEAFKSRSNCQVIVGDVATMIRTKQPFVSSARLFLLDELREQSVGYFFKESDQFGLTHIDSGWSKEGLDVISAIERPPELASADYNPAYGIAIHNIIDVSKTTGYLKLRERFPAAMFYMVGDADADIIDDDRVTHCAVANATSRLKAISVYVSNKPITRGLRDCLEWIRKQREST